MEYKLATNLNNLSNQTLVIGVFKDQKTNEVLEELNIRYYNLPDRLAKKIPNENEYIFQAEVEDHSLFLINCGKSEKFNTYKLNKLIKKIADKLCEYQVLHATVCLPISPQISPDTQLKQMVVDFTDSCYQFLDFKSEKQTHKLKTISIYLKGAKASIIDQALCVSEGITLARNLANLPANVCTPSYLAETAIDIAKNHQSVETKIIEQDEMQKLGMNALLGVAKGSREAPKLIEIKYLGADKNTAPVVLVGKGITFDSGGISIKPSELMNEMKYDMAGSAAVLGTIKACALLKLPINLIGLVASAENMPDGNALKPGDIVKSMKGLTIEITNTDAEGRLVLCDALTYAERFNPEFVIDIATLTGAMIVALGTSITGYMTKDEKLSKLIDESSIESGDKAWRLPLESEYNCLLDSPIADMVNSAPSRAAGSITAGIFLSKFSESFRWAHLDIAGSGWVSGNKRNATGRPVPLLIHILENVAKN